MNNQEGEDVQFDLQFGPMQSTQLPRNNSSANNEEEGNAVKVANSFMTNNVSDDWKPEKPII